MSHPEFFNAALAGYLAGFAHIGIGNAGMSPTFQEAAVRFAKAVEMELADVTDPAVVNGKMLEQLCILGIIRGQYGEWNSDPQDPQGFVRRVVGLYVERVERMKRPPPSPVAVPSPPEMRTLNDRRSGDRPMPRQNHADTAAFREFCDAMRDEIARRAEAPRASLRPEFLRIARLAWRDPAYRTAREAARAKAERMRA